MNEQALFERLDRIAGHLDRIAGALEKAVALPPAEPAAPACLHPLDRRVDFGQTNGVDDWQCGVCGYRTVEQSAEVTVG